MASLSQQLPSLSTAHRKGLSHSGCSSKRSVEHREAQSETRVGLGLLGTGGRGGDIWGGRRPEAAVGVLRQMTKANLGSKERSQRRQA